MMKKEGIMLMVKDDELRCFMEFNEETINNCIEFREYDKFHDDFIVILYKTDDEILRNYVTSRIVRKQNELTKEMIYECFNMDLKVKGLEKYVVNNLFKNVRY